MYDTVTVQSIQYTNEVVEVTPERDFYICVQDYTVRTGEVVQEKLLNTYTGAFAAYSFRLLNGFYKGPAIQAERFADAATKDIYFTDDGLLDTETLETFANGGGCGIRVWYDQTNQGRHVEQTTQV